MPVIVNLTMMALCLLGSSGRVAWADGWILMALSFLTGVAAEAVVARNPGLGAERRNLAPGKAWDKAIVAWVVLLGPVATWITAGLDVRHGWSTDFPVGASAVGVAVTLGGGALLVWAMRVNAFFSSVVRIQSDRGHTVVTGGPYGLMRHPGYAGMSAFMLATPLVLRSWWALIPAGMTVAVNVLRTALEDGVLQAKLEGYADYARAVKFKLVPFLW